MRSSVPSFQASLRSIAGIGARFVQAFFFFFFYERDDRLAERGGNGARQGSSFQWFQSL